MKFDSRFLHDIISVLMRDKGIFDGLFTEEELVSDNVKGKNRLFWNFAFYFMFDYFSSLQIVIKDTTTQSNMFTTITLGTQNLWPSLIGGRYSEVALTRF
jgi:hypothetical protein